tara:strand:- start:1899 stop:2582 length:684 start_codon:yes stop_codon:yes gene_type:complete
MNMIDFLAIAIIFFGAFAYFIDSLSLKIRLISGISSNVAIFNHMSLVSMMLNRFSVALLLPILGYLIDVGVNQNYLIKVISSSILVYVIMNSLLILFSFKITVFISSFLRFYGQAAGKIQKEIFSIKNYYPDLPSALFYFLIIVGFFLPAIVASFFPEWRATIMQLGFTINVFGTLLNVFFIERKVSLAINSGIKKEVVMLIRQILIGRFLGALVASLFIFSILFFV